MTRSKGSKTKYLLRLFLAVIIIINLILAYLYYLTQPISSNSSPKIFNITSGQSVSVIAKNLKEEKLIRSDIAFKLLYYIKDRQGLIEGSYSLSGNMQLSDIIDLTSNGKTSKIKITLLEGKRSDDLIKQLAVATKVDQAKLKEEFLHNSTSAIVNERANKNSIEGYIFPDTYSFNVGSSYQDIVGKIYQNTQNKFSSLDFNGSSLSFNQALTLASIVEKEAMTIKDRKMVAQVFLNRLDINMPLQSDVTIDYITGHQVTTPEDIDIDSPYNTYKNKGLTPTPICNIGLEAIEAVLKPIPNDYIFFLADKNGVVHYSKTLEQHNSNIELYLNH